MDWAYGVQVIFVVVITSIVSTAVTATALVMIIFIIVSIVPSCVASVASRVATFLGIFVFQGAKPLKVLGLFSKVGRAISCSDHRLFPSPWAAILQDNFEFIVGESGCEVASIDGCGHPYDQVVQSLKFIV